MRKKSKHLCTRIYIYSIFSSSELVFKNIHNPDCNRTYEQYPKYECINFKLLSITGVLNG